MDRAAGENFCSMSDEQVVLLSQKGDEDALNHIIARYRNFVYSKANTYFLAGAEKEDVVQEGMIGLYKAVKEYNPDNESSFKRFAGVCVSNQILSAVKAATRKKHLPLNSYISLCESGAELENDESQGVYIEDREKNPEDIIIGQENQSMMEYKINKALSKLGLNLRPLGGAAYKTGAECSGVMNYKDEYVTKGTIVEAYFIVNDETG